MDFPVEINKTQNLAVVLLLQARQHFANSPNELVARDAPCGFTYRVAAVSIAAP